MLKEQNIRNSLRRCTVLLRAIIDRQSITMPIVMLVSIACIEAKKFPTDLNKINISS